MTSHRIWLIAAVALALLLSRASGAETFDCTKAAMPTDFVVCSSADLRTANENLAKLWTETRERLDADQKKELVASQRAWLTWVTVECGLPPHGRPSPAAIQHAQTCVGHAVAARTQGLETLLADPKIEAGDKAGNEIVRAWWVEQICGWTTSSKTLTWCDSKELYRFCGGDLDGRGMAQCQEHVDRILEIERTGSMIEATRNWQKDEMNALRHLQERYEDYATDHIDNEIDSSIGSGTTAAVQTGKERDRLDGAFRDLLNGVAKCDIVPAYDSRIDDERAELNRLLTSFAAANPGKGYWGNITQDGIREAQQSWQEYRDAWLALFRRVCPAASEDNLSLRLLQQRNYALRDLSQFLDLPPATTQ